MAQDCRRLVPSLGVAPAGGISGDEIEALEHL